MSEKFILITGAAGFIGSYLRNYLKSEYKLICLDNFDPQVHGHQPQVDEEVIKFDISCDDFSELGQFGEPVAIYHLAAKTGTAQSMYELESYYSSNVLGSIRLLDFAKTHLGSLEHFIFASSRSVYGEGTYICNQCSLRFSGRRSIDDLRSNSFFVVCPVCRCEGHSVATSETDELDPTSHYALSKLAVERAIDLVFENTTVCYSSLRFQNVFGIGQSLKNPYTGVLGIFTSLALKERDIEIFESGNISRDFVSVLDVADVLVRCLSTTNLPPRLNVGTGVAIPLFDAAVSIVENLHSMSKISVSNSYRRGDVAVNYACLENFNKIFPGYKFRDFFDILPSYLDWVRAQGGLDLVSFDKSMRELREAGEFRK